MTAKFDFIPDSQATSQFDFVPDPAPKTALQRWGEGEGAANFGARALKGTAATLAQGGTNIANSLKAALGEMPAVKNPKTGQMESLGKPAYDNTNYFKEYGVEPNIATDIGTGLVETLPYAIAPEMAIAKIPQLLTATGKALAGRTAVRGATGAGMHENLEKGKGRESSIGEDALMGALFGVTGGVGDYLPILASKLAGKMTGSRLPNEAIAEGNRAAEFADVGNIVGNSKGAEKWDQLTNTIASPAKKEQEALYSELGGRKYDALKKADEQAMKFYEQMGGKEGVPLNQAISDDIIKQYGALKAEGGAKFKALEPELEKVIMKDYPTIRPKAAEIMEETKDALASGIRDKDIRADLAARAKNATEREKEIAVNMAIKEERNLSSIGADLKASGDGAAARYYNDLAQAYRADIDAAIEAGNPKLLPKLKDARDFWKNNVIPFNESTMARKIINNNFDESLSPLNISNTLTNGQQNQLLSVLPEETRNKVAADLLFKKSFDAVGAKEHPSIALAAAVNSGNPARLSPLLNEKSNKTLKDIMSAVDKNKDVLQEIGKKTKTIKSGEGSESVGAASHGDVRTSLRNLAEVPTAPYWSRFLSAKENPELLGAVLQGRGMNMQQVREAQAADTLLEALRRAVSPREQLASVLSNPNKTRVPLAAAVEGTRKREE